MAVVVVAVVPQLSVVVVALRVAESCRIPQRPAEKKLK
jgi:hypothetical protein